MISDRSPVANVLSRSVNFLVLLFKSARTLGMAGSKGSNDIITVGTEVMPL